MLVIQCGDQKVATTQAVPVWSLYTGPLWSSYRKIRKEREGREVSGPHPTLDVYVLSAEYGLLHESARCPLYDRILVPDSYRRQTKRGAPVRRVGEIVDKVRDQARRRGLTEVYVVAGVPYPELLERAGLVVHNLDPRGIGFKRNTLGRFLKQAPLLDLDALLAEIEG